MIVPESAGSDRIDAAAICEYNGFATAYSILAAGDCLRGSSATMH
jgi:hypothetical protein